MRRAWDGRYYTISEFLAWYGRDRGFDFWNEAASADLPGGRACPRDLSEMIAVSFVLLSGHKACEDMVVARSPGPSARVLRDHLRRGSHRLRYSTLMIGDKILDLDCGNVFALDQAEVMLANTPGCLRLSVIRKALWTPSELATSSG